jgi:hypothetical protein
MLRYSTHAIVFPVQRRCSGGGVLLQEDVMSSPALANRLRSASEFTCSRCGGREAYTCQSQRAFDRYLLTALAIQPARCCDCDALCYAFPVRPQEPVLSGCSRTALVPVPRPESVQARVEARPAVAPTMSPTWRKFPHPTPNPIHGANSNGAPNRWAVGA